MKCQCYLRPPLIPVFLNFFRSFILAPSFWALPSSSIHQKRRSKCVEGVNRVPPRNMFKYINLILMSCFSLSDMNYWCCCWWCRGSWSFMFSSGYMRNDKMNESNEQMNEYFGGEGRLTSQVGKNEWWLAPWIRKVNGDNLKGFHIVSRRVAINLNFIRMIYGCEA